MWVVMESNHPSQWQLIYSQPRYHLRYNNPFVPVVGLEPTKLSFLRLGTLPIRFYVTQAYNKNPLDQDDQGDKRVIKDSDGLS